MITAGIDEVGRGCWAGPLVAGAVILPGGFNLEDCPLTLRDSKKLSKMQREAAADWIHHSAVTVGLGWVTAKEIDEIGLSKAVGLAMDRAVSQLQVVCDRIIIDGSINYFPDDPRALAIIKADDSVPCVSAASIIAKVARDAYMAELGEKYAGYGFDKHVGYGTASHITALRKLGVSDIHRFSYKPIRALLV